MPSPKNPINQQDIFCSWSGGKDICLAVHRAVESGARLKTVLCMLDETGDRSRSHGLPKPLLEAQAKRMNANIVFRSATWHDYTDAFIDGLQEIRATGLQHGVFGDIDIDSHRQWVIDACTQASVIPHHPLWQDNREKLVREGIARGIKSRIVVVNTTHLPESFLGMQLTEDTMQAIIAHGADACGENGEYHTLVTDAPMFDEPIHASLDQVVRFGDYAFHKLKTP